MALYSIENVGDWTEGGFTGALVTAANENEARRLVADYARGVELKVEKLSTATAKRLHVGFNG